MTANRGLVSINIDDGAGVTPCGKQGAIVRFTDRVLAVTGGGAGIGEATVRKLAGDGAIVVIADLDDAGGNRLVAEVTAAGGRAAFVPIDVSKEPDADALVCFALDTFGRFDGAVNNAGIGQRPPRRIHELDTGAWDRVHAIDLRGLFFCLRAELKHFVHSGGGVIVNVASVAGLKAEPGIGAYVAAKHGVIGLTKSAAIEYAADNIRVTAVAPGIVATTTLSRSIPGDPQKLYSSRQPGGRAAQPGEIANAIAWLLSDEASFVSGDTLLVDAALAQT
jgi:NAD(P)-dependent dehydrogenase (short-subunit alcohol dehydrogenase family)